VMRVRNAFVEDDGTYRGINVGLRTKDGKDLEVQLHTGKSFYAKQRNHKYYEKLRSLSSTIEAGSDRADGNDIAVFDAERARLSDLMRSETASVEMPAAVETIISFRHY
ncbi:hypothetical protein SB751_28380, partial [Cupriavidus sp. SIMBA_020]